MIEIDTLELLTIAVGPERSFQVLSKMGINLKRVQSSQRTAIQEFLKIADVDVGQFLSYLKNLELRDIYEYLDSKPTGRTKSELIKGLSSSRKSNHGKMPNSGWNIMAS